jgi:4-hydroxybenzoate polyprenyltransferase
MQNTNIAVFTTKLLRVKQWVKNAFILFPLIFSGNLMNAVSLFNNLVTLVGFCFISSSVYILNDYIDRDKDKFHPTKSQRPLAQTKIPVSIIGLIVISLMTLGLFIISIASPIILIPAVVYILIHIVYNLIAKNIVILDVIFIAIGFQVRIWAGALACSVLPSVWLQLCVFVLALFLGFTKRRYELSTLKNSASEHRSVLAHYTSYLLDQIIIISSTLAIIFYSLYTISPELTARIGNHNMIYSITFVIYGMFRYLYLVHVKKLGDDPGEILFHDKSLWITVLGWIVYICVLLYT